MVFIKKVDNSDAGDSNTVGGNDWDKLDDYFNDSVNILTGEVNSTLKVVGSKFAIRDATDLTKEIISDVSAITTGTTRTITYPDANVDFGGLTNSNLAAGSFTNITGVGTITAGVWNGTAIDIANLDTNVVVDNATSTFISNQIFNDSVKLLLGTGSDVEIYYDGTDLIIDPDAVGGGDLKIDAQQIILSKSNSTQRFVMDRPAILGDGTNIGSFRASALNANSVSKNYAQIFFKMEEDTAGGEDGSIKLNILKDGSSTDFLTINDGNSGTIELLKSTNVTGTLTASTLIDTPDIETGTVSARDGSLAITISDTTGISTFVTGAVLVAPALGTPASGVLTNCTGLPEAGLLDNAVTLDKMVGGTDGNLITFDTSGDPAYVATGTANQVLTSNGAGTAPTFQAAGGGGSITFTDAVLCVLEIPEGTVAFPDIIVLATAGAKIDGFVLPDGASISTINFKCVVPRDVASTPAMKIRIRAMTLAADSDHAVRLTVSTIGLAVNEDHDASQTAETEITAEMPDGIETGNEAIIEVDLTTDWAADDTVLGQLKRDPVDAVDDYAGDILITGIELLVDRTIS